MPTPIVGIDVGTTKVCTLIGEQNEESGLRVVDRNAFDDYGKR